ncbi:MAG: hypothetical protein R2735_00610 [Microthrixaceae bacterium]
MTLVFGPCSFMRDDDARSFYEHHGEFVASPTDPLHLFMHLKHARRLLTSD